MKTHEEFVKNLRERYEAGITDTPDPWTMVRVVDYWDGPRAYDAEDVDRARAAVETAHRTALAAEMSVRKIAEEKVKKLQAEVTRLTQERDALRIQNEQMRQELLDIGAALRDPADNLIDTTAQCITRLRTERDALAAQVAGLREALRDIVKLGPRCDECSRTHWVIQTAEDALNGGK